MAKLAQVVIQLKKERERRANELRQLDNAIEVLKTLSSNTGSASPRRSSGLPRRKLSAAARRRIAAAQRARWARVRKEKAAK